METQPEPIIETRHLRLFHLQDPTHPWKIYVLEGSDPELLAMLQAFYSRSAMGIEERLRTLLSDEEAALKLHADKLGDELRTRLAKQVGEANDHVYAPLLDESNPLELNHKQLTHLIGTTQEAFSTLDKALAKQVSTETLQRLTAELLTASEETLNQKTGEFMATYYVGYGHKSIGDCGSCVIILEGVPMHLATQIQSSALVNCQERSTRYQDMSNGRLWNPLGTAAGEAILKRWLDFNQRAKAILEAELSAQFTFVPTNPENAKQTAREQGLHKRAIAARAFDIARGFLPIGASTSLTWGVNLRQAYDHLRQLMHHPDPMTRMLASDVFRFMQLLYTSSFSSSGRAATHAWLDEAMRFAPEATRGAETTSVHLDSMTNEPRLTVGLGILADRPEGADVPRHLRNLAQFTVKSRLDFGSFRDVHRHRSCDIPIARIDWDCGFESWYLERLPTALRLEADQFLREQKAAFDQLEGDPYLRQCYASLGTLMPFELRGSLGALIYVIELRSKSDVHPTVRKLIWEVADGVQAYLPQVPMAIDRTPDRFILRRGSQTILDGNGQAV